jgi:peptidoglycan/LPS O-acetylase OafA/YrhL
MPKYTPTTSGRPAEHLPQLDGLRCFAALLVVWQHAGAQPWRGVRGVGLDGVGIYAVRIFFVLSAFLITGILLRVRDQRTAIGGSLTHALWTFYARRALRIFPAYFLLLALAVLLGTAMVPGELAAALTYRTNWFIAARPEWPPALGHLWSLAIEEQFYLAWPLVILLSPRTWLPRLLAGLALVSFCWRVHLALGSATDMAVLISTTGNLEALAVGALLAWHRHARPGAHVERSRATGLALLIGLLIFGAVIYLSAHVGPVRFLGIIEVTSGALVGVWLVDRMATGLGGLVGRFLASRPITYLGSISYGIYLYHELLRWVLLMLHDGTMNPPLWTKRGSPEFVAVLLLSSIAVAALSSRYIEQPINRLKRFVPSSATQGASAFPVGARWHA